MHMAVVYKNTSDLQRSLHVGDNIITREKKQTYHTKIGSRPLVLPGTLEELTDRSRPTLIITTKDDGKWKS